MTTTAETVTEDGSAHVRTDATRDECWNDECWNGCQYGSTSRRWGFVKLHCSTCHGSDHWACSVCGKCLERRSRLDRVYCGNACRAKASKQRERARLEHEAWAAEHPEEASQLEADSAARRERLEELGRQIGDAFGSQAELQERELRRHAGRCSECDRSFSSSEVIYRRRKGSEWRIEAPVLPYCHEHRCTAFEGRHNSDAGPGWVYENCRCDDSAWTDPLPCLGCNRLVAFPKGAKWRKGHYVWLPDREHGSMLIDHWREPRVLCGEECRRRVDAVEKKSRRLRARASRTPKSCVICDRDITHKRADADTCSDACRQAKYRRKSVADETSPAGNSAPVGNPTGRTCSELNTSLAEAA